MLVAELRPSTRRALRRQVLGGCASTVIGLLLVVGTVAVLLAASHRAGERGDELRVPGAALPLVVGWLMVWHGVIEVPRRVWALRAPGARVELRPVTAPARRRRFLSRAGHGEARHAWLVGSVGTNHGEELAIPVDPWEADRMVGGTAALVRGRFEPGGRVVLDFPEEVVFATGRVIPVAAGLPSEAAYAEVRARADVPTRASVRWRVVLAAALALLAVVVAVEEDDGDAGERCGRLPGSLLDPRSAACLDQAQFQVGFSSSVGTGAALLAWSARRRIVRREAAQQDASQGPDRVP